MLKDVARHPLNNCGRGEDLRVTRPVEYDNPNAPVLVKDAAKTLAVQLRGGCQFFGGNKTDHRLKLLSGQRDESERHDFCQQLSN